MPRKSDLIKLSETLDRRKKLTEEQKDDIRALKKEGLNMAELARQYHVSKYTIKCVLEPKYKAEQNEKCKKRQKLYRAIERADIEKREKRNEKRREHKNYKKALYERGIIE